MAQFAEWQGFAPKPALPTISSLNDWLDDDSGMIEARDDHVILSHAAVAALNDPQALSIGLPTAAPFELKLDTNGLITASDFRVIASCPTTVDVCTATHD